MRSPPWQERLTRRRFGERHFGVSCEPSTLGSLPLQAHGTRFRGHGTDPACWGLRCVRCVCGGGPGGGNSEPSGDLWVCHGLALPEEDFVEEVAPDGLDPRGPRPGSGARDEGSRSPRGSMRTGPEREASGRWPASPVPRVDAGVGDGAPEAAPGSERLGRDRPGPAAGSSELRPGGLGAGLRQRLGGKGTCRGRLQWGVMGGQRGGLRAETPRRGATP